QGNEQCDDNGTVPGDGCSPVCVIDPGYDCGGEPSVCFVQAIGDSCEMAPTLIDGVYSLDGYTPERDCASGSCSSPSRWFRLDVPRGNTLVLEMTTTDLQSGEVWVYGLESGPCYHLPSGGEYG